MTNTGVDAWRAFKDKLTKCFVFAHLYEQSGQLEDRFVVDLVRRLFNYAKQRCLDYLNDRFCCTSNSTLIARRTV